MEPRSLRRAGLSAVARVLVIWVITAATLMLLSALLAGFTVDIGAARPERR